MRVKTGPLMGLEGILTRKKGVARLVVSMEMLGRSAAVEIDVLNVERIGPISGAKAIRPSDFGLRVSVTQLKIEFCAIQWTFPYFNSVLPRR